MTDFSDREAKNKKMNGKSKLPFAITCRGCGSDDVTVTAYDFHGLEIYCNSCGKTLDCGRYQTMNYDYSDC